MTLLKEAPNGLEKYLETTKRCMEQHSVNQLATIASSNIVPRIGRCRRRTATASIATKIDNHTFNGDHRLSQEWRDAWRGRRDGTTLRRVLRSSTNRRRDEMSLNEVERVVIFKEGWKAGLRTLDENH